jgi:hypothetical protein
MNASKMIMIVLVNPSLPRSRRRRTTYTVGRFGSTYRRAMRRNRRRHYNSFVVQHALPGFGVDDRITPLWRYYDQVS